MEKDWKEIDRKKRILRKVFDDRDIPFRVGGYSYSDKRDIIEAFLALSPSQVNTLGGLGDGDINKGLQLVLSLFFHTMMEHSQGQLAWDWQHKHIEKWWDEYSGGQRANLWDKVREWKEYIENYKKHYLSSAFDYDIRIADGGGI